MLKFTLFFLIVFVSFNLKAQLYTTVGDSYGIATINTSACEIADTCFTLTDATNNQAGAVWDLNPLNLNNSFDAIFCMTLGDHDANGADGFAFVMRGVNSLDFGSVGGGLGYVNIQPSVAIEFDTWDNGSVTNDIAEDHTGLYFNGDQSSPIVSSVPLNINGDNVEDGNYHVTRVSWNSLTSTLNMYFDGELRMTYTGDLVNTVFNGDSDVIWGFTASTGGFNNLQQICFPKNQLPPLPDPVICDYDSIPLHFYTDYITSYNWVGPDGNDIVDWNTVEYTTELDLSDTVFIAKEPGDYILNVTFNNFMYSDTATVSHIPLPLTKYNGDTILYCPDLVDLTLTGAEDNGTTYYYLEPDETTSGYFVENDTNNIGEYHIHIVEPILGCFNDDSVYIDMFCEPTFEVPTIFTPNNDMSNETFNLVFGKITEKWTNVEEFTIFNRWGNIIYSINSGYPMWDGTADGNKEFTDGVYYYKLAYKDADNNKREDIYGFFTLKR